ncbi:uncharacterized protein BDW47DRAFT_5081 [Aspergillus candidus]|uniref:Uncharacterized protein n=1 Tax=Aspergillus candidus TaxID=41067 RepID=A0A2I2FHD7_ASPCN|nr:hypothetical protein BDW47DRAFT_5081 [Aspergillus candidus]PLB40019.1 hypothetical protein BDW47DRAFT_5081 [Aspergillus candidus]
MSDTSEAQEKRTIYRSALRSIKEESLNWKTLRSAHRKRATRGFNRNHCLSKTSRTIHTSFLRSRRLSRPQRGQSIQPIMTLSKTI